MREQNRAMLDAAVVAARESNAHAVLLAAALPEETEYLERALRGERRVISAAIGPERGPERGDLEVVRLPEVRLRRRGRAKVALMEGLAAGLFQPGERVVVISGNASDEGCALDTVAMVDLSAEEGEEAILEGEPGAPLSLLRDVGDPAVFDALLGLCIQLGKEGKEGKPVGLIATLGDHEAVLKSSHQLVLNPFEGHAEEELSILNAAARRAVREFSGMDGAFVLRSDGVLVAAGRYLQVGAAEGMVPTGLGSRHRACAGITRRTRAIAFALSESTGDTRVFGGGRILMTVERTD